MKLLVLSLITWLISFSNAYKNYTGHKVITALPKSDSELQLIRKLRFDYLVDLWNEPRILGFHVMMHLSPDQIKPVENLLKENNIEYDVAYYNLQRAIDDERETLYQSPSEVVEENFDFGKYHTHESIINFIKDLTSKYPDVVKLETIGKSYENRPIHNLRISSGNSWKKPSIMIECGIHAREWSSVAAGTYLANRLITTYGEDPMVTSLLDKYEINIILLSNPDGYIFSWEKERLWRKTRSYSELDKEGVCLGVDANRNFDIEHCGVGTSRKPCEEIFCGDKPFSESEARALRDMMYDKKDRMAAYFSLHAFSQCWMTPYGISKKLPADYDELIRVGQIGVDALAKKYGTTFTLGSIGNVFYEATGSSVDFAYEKVGIKMAFTLELRDRGRHGFILPAKLITPMCEETYDGLIAAIQALKE